MPRPHNEWQAAVDLARYYQQGPAPQFAPVDDLIGVLGRVCADAASALGTAAAMLGAALARCGCANPVARHAAEARRLYAWEDRYFARKQVNRLITTDECRALVSRICRDAGVVPPRVQRERNRRHSYAYGDAEVIILPLPLQRPWVVCHEAAHALCCLLHPRAAECGHGGAFAGVYRRLLIGYCGAHPARLTKSMTNAGIIMHDWVPRPWACSCSVSAGSGLKNEELVSNSERDIGCSSAPAIN